MKASIAILLLSLAMCCIPGQAQKPNPDTPSVEHKNNSGPLAWVGTPGITWVSSVSANLPAKSALTGGPRTRRRPHCVPPFSAGVVLIIGGNQRR